MNGTADPPALKFIREISKNADESARAAKNAVNAAHTTNETIKKLGEGDRRDRHRGSSALRFPPESMLA